MIQSLSSYAGYTTPEQSQENTALGVIVQQQQAQLAQLGAVIQQLGTLVAAMDQRFQQLEKLTGQKVTITSSQAKVIRKEIQSRAMEICEKHSLDYAKHGEAIRRDIREMVFATYSIRDVHDLPASYFDLCQERIKAYYSFKAIRKLREQETA